MAGVVDLPAYQSVRQQGVTEVWHYANPPRLIAFQGETLSLAGWGRKLGMSRERVRQRINRYPVELALNPEVCKAVRVIENTLGMTVAIVKRVTP